MSLYNEDELSPPSWIAKDFLCSVLIAYKNIENLEVLNFELTPASLKNEHYASIMFRAKVSYSDPANGATETVSLIIKTIPEEQCAKREWLLMSRIFETEIRMYAETIPRIEEILREHGDDTALAPRMIYHALEPHKVIIMEDLCERGYALVRDRFLNEAEMQLTYGKLAKLHAVSYMLGQSEEHEVVSAYREGMLSHSYAFQHPLIAGATQKFIQMLTKHEDLASYVPKFQAVEAELNAACIQLFCAYQQGRKDEIFVLNHGDFHMKNLMFKSKKTSELEDVLLIDLQLCTFAPSLIDLTYSNYIMYNADLLQNPDGLWRYYWDHFIATLKLIKYDGALPTFGNLKIATIRYRHYAIFLLTTFLPMTGMYESDTSENIDLAQYFSDPELKATLYHNPIFVEKVRRLLPKLLHKGYLD